VVRVFVAGVAAAAALKEFHTTMSSGKDKLRLAAAFAILAVTALAVSCTGFFVNPTLTAVTVGPSGVSLDVGATYQMTATGTYSDGTQKTLNSGVVWSSDTPANVTVGENSGLVAGVAVGTATISASSGGCSSCQGSTTVTVVLTTVTSITVTPNSQTESINGTAVNFIATAEPGSIDISESATWNVYDSTGTNQTANFSLSYAGTGLGESILAGSSAVAGTYSVVASYTGSTVTGKATLIVN
jgi:hypothetical protein